MDRKDFIALGVPFFSVVQSLGRSEDMELESRTSKVPPFLKVGDVIGITCPSGYISLEDIQPAVKTLIQWGFQVKIGNTVGLKDFSLAGTDDKRAEDLQAMLNDQSIAAILFGRGGYGAVRIIDKIDFSFFRKHPKWIIGFSDATVFHSHINRQFGIPTIHSKMCNSFKTDSDSPESQIKSIDSIRKILTGEVINYPIPTNAQNRTGNGSGKLIGGNLSILQNLSGTRSGIRTKGKILFLEDVGEYMYSIDRMLWNLKRCGMLHELAGLIVGRFSMKPDEVGEEFGKTLYDIVMEKVNEYQYPVVFDFPVGHVKENYALKCGVLYTLHVEGDTCTLNEYL